MLSIYIFSCKKIILVGQNNDKMEAKYSSTSSWTPKWFSSRRSSNTGQTNSAPVTSRLSNGNIETSCNPSPTLTRLWNSIKAFGNEESTRLSDNKLPN